MRSTRRRFFSRAVIGALLALTVVAVLGMVAVSAAQGDTVRVSVDGAGTQANDYSDDPTLSADGRFVAFHSAATNLVIGDTNGHGDIFVKDRDTGAVARVSVHSDGTQGTDESYEPAISADGRYVAFTSLASNLVDGDTNATWDIFVHDRVTETTTRVSVHSNGTEGSGASYRLDISADGRYVTFDSEAGNLVDGDTNFTWDVFVHDRVLETTARVSVHSNGAQGSQQALHPAISGDGRYVAFESGSPELVDGDTNDAFDVYRHDRSTGTTIRVSVDSAGVQATAESATPSITADGASISFHSLASDLVVGDTNANEDVFTHDVATGVTTRVSVGSDGAQGTGASSWSSISGNGRYVAFRSDAPDLVAGDTNTNLDVFVHDRNSGSTSRVSVHSDGTEAASHSEYQLAISTDGRYVAFASFADNLVDGDTNDDTDVFVHQYLPAAPPPTSSTTTPRRPRCHRVVTGSLTTTTRSSRATSRRSPRRGSPWAAIRRSTTGSAPPMQSPVARWRPS